MEEARLRGLGLSVLRRPPRARLVWVLVRDVLKTAAGKWGLVPVLPFMPILLLRSHTGGRKGMDVSRYVGLLAAATGATMWVILEISYWVGSGATLRLLAAAGASLLVVALGQIIPAIRAFLRADADDMWGIDGAGDAYRDACRRLPLDTQAELLLWTRPVGRDKPVGALSVAEAGGLAVAQYGGGEVTVAEANTTESDTGE